MELLFKIVIWLFFWPVILLLQLVFWLTEVVHVPWTVLGILYAVLVVVFFGFLLWLDLRDSGETCSRGMKLSWLTITVLTAVSVLAMALLSVWFSYQMEWVSQILIGLALMTPILVGCLGFLLSFLEAFGTCRRPNLRMAVVCGLTAVLIPVLFGGGSHLVGLAELKDLQKSASVYEGTVVDRAMSERGKYIGVEFADGSGTCFYEVYGAPFPEGISLGDRVRITASGDKAVSAEITE